MLMITEKHIYGLKRVNHLGFSHTGTFILVDPFVCDALKSIINENMMILWKSNLVKISHMHGKNETFIKN